MEIEKVMNIKTIAGIGAGVAIGFFLVKTKKPLALMAFGVGGGLLANQLLKTRGEKVAKIQEQSDNYMQQVKEDVNATLVVKDEPDYGGQKMAFNPTVGYITPVGEVEDEQPTDYMDIGF
jgi:hypothetical protein